MTLQIKNPWKVLSIGLLGVIALGLLIPVDAAPPNKENEATEVDCENPCIDETELTFDPATQEDLNILDGTVAGLILDLAAEATARAEADTILTDDLAQEVLDRITDVDAEEARALAAEAEIQANVDSIVEPADWNVYKRGASAVSVGPGEWNFARAACDDFNDIALEGTRLGVGSVEAYQQTFSTWEVLLQPSCFFDEGLGEWDCSTGSYLSGFKNTHDTLTSQQHVDIHCLEVPGTGDPEE